MKVIGRKQTLSISNTLLVPRSFVLRSLYGSEAKMRTFLSHLHYHGLLIETHFAEALDGCGDRRVLCVVLCCVVLRFVCRVVLRWALSCFILASYTATWLYYQRSTQNPYYVGFPPRVQIIRSAAINIRSCFRVCEPLTNPYHVKQLKTKQSP
jgi:hypothetical protein